ncbi:MAG TPA: aminopeptidase P family protein [Polyangiaceae bacterium]|nr:aminopeptidase P family protein [Polyangiaceae bacterium]
MSGGALDARERARRVEALRAELAQRNLAAYIVPRSDEYMLEYVPASGERLAWLTGFTGSAGMAVVGRARAALFVDGRYTEQAREQAPEPLWEHHHLIDAPPSAWIEQALQSGERVGYDPRVHTPSALEGLKAAAQRVGASLAPVEANLVDALWTDRPAEPLGPLELYPESLAGESSASKRARMAEKLAGEKLDALVVTAADSLAWLLNIRGADLENTPFALGRAILRASGALTLFMHVDKIGPDVRAYLNAQAALAIAAPAELVGALRELSGSRVRVDRLSASEWLIAELNAAGAKVDVGADPCTLAKACKTPAELAAIRAAHVRDGVAMVRFLCWFAREVPGAHDEWSVSEKLGELRALGEHYRGPSFHTISAFGPSAALPHYRASRESARRLQSGNVYLVDSGGQYLDGTTDITRVTVIGEPSLEQRRRYTQVLKGHLALGRAQFPAGTTGSQLDPFARQFLWHDGVDFDHGTGHGVGCYLSVHEGPHSISKRPSDVALRPGMIVSNEPGYYKPGHFGIRIENLISVVELRPQPAGAERTTLGFETLTLCPYERRLIDGALLTAEERAQVDEYHARVRSVLAPLVADDPGVSEYLAQATAPLEPHEGALPGV